VAGKSVEVEMLLRAFGRRGYCWRIVRVNRWVIVAMVMVVGSYGGEGVTIEKC
jgi:hypothetical protein